MIYVVDRREVLVIGVRVGLRRCERIWKRK